MKKCQSSSQTRTSDVNPPQPKPGKGLLGNYSNCGPESLILSWQYFLLFIIRVITSSEWKPYFMKLHKHHWWRFIPGPEDAHWQSNDGWNYCWQFYKSFYQSLWAIKPNRAITSKISSLSVLAHNNPFSNPLYYNQSVYLEVTCLLFLKWSESLKLYFSPRIGSSRYHTKQDKIALL